MIRRVFPLIALLATSMATAQPKVSDGGTPPAGSSPPAQTAAPDKTPATPDPNRQQAAKKALGALKGDKNDGKDQPKNSR